MKPAGKSHRTSFAAALAALILGGGPFARAGAGWPADLLAARTNPEALDGFRRTHAVAWDWLLQDGGLRAEAWFASGAIAAMAGKAVGEVAAQSPSLRLACDALGADAGGEAWLDLYARTCEIRRAARLAAVRAAAPRMVFTKHRTVLPSFFAYTEGQSDAQAERHFHPGSSLCLLEIDGMGEQVRTLLEDPSGAIRDPAVSWDGKRVLFAWKKALNDDDYHLYEMEAATGKIRQLTRGAGVADYEGAYLPDGSLVFSSTRCVQTVDCFWTEVSNLYTCDRDGNHVRRLGYDQVHTVFPTVANDGGVLYTRWDYNDRGQVFPQPLFKMNPDGTGQAAFYGGNSWFPTTIAHARAIPGSHKVVAILTGHHAPQAGKLAILDPAKGREENAGVQLVAPVRETKAERIDSYGQQGELFQYPWPLGESEFLVTYAPAGWERDERQRRADAAFGIYWMHADGRRELLASDPAIPCSQPVPLVARAAPPVRPSFVNHATDTGTFYIQDIHEGPGLRGIPRGSIRKLRVVALDFRAAGIGHNSSGGPGGGAMISTPISIGNGSWDVKIVLGDADVYEDGSAFFVAPARTPVYFQALDEKGHAVQTMRSWSTLQPGENQSCVGCHESRNSAPLAPPGGATLALRAGAKPLAPFHGPPRGFSFAREVQPVLDAKCISCHDRRGERPGARSPDGRHAFSLLDVATEDEQAKRLWSDAYLALTGAKPDKVDGRPRGFRGDVAAKLVNWIGSQSPPEMLPPKFAGAARSGLIGLLEAGHYGVVMTRGEMDKIACWIDLLVPFCGDYREAAAWTPDEEAKYERYFEKRRTLAAGETGGAGATP